jgi:hypothetical protein
MKKTLLIAAAALAASVISSQAQVYSQNIVGYINKPLPQGFTPIANPLNNGTNGLFDVIPNIPDLSFVYVWNGTSYAAYETYQGVAYDETGTYQVTTPNLTVGNGVFINASSAFTNTFVGTVLVTNGAAGSITTNNVNLVQGFNFLNAPIPLGGGVISNLQLGAIPDLSFVYTWNGTTWVGAETYQGAFYDETGTYTVSEPQVQAGSAFFVNSSAPFTWSVTYTNK